MVEFFTWNILKLKRNDEEFFSDQRYTIHIIKKALHHIYIYANPFRSVIIVYCNLYTNNYVHLCWMHF